MAAVSLSPTPAHLSTMSTRRPLSSNPNAANSPLRGTTASLLGPKLKARSHATMMREEAYGQPPPAKRQMVEHGVQRPVPSPTRSRAARTVIHRGVTKTVKDAGAERAAQNGEYKPSEEEVENLRLWQTQIRSRFPNMVFYFESIPDEQRSKLTKQVIHLGAREEKFFSINITHVVTTRPIPLVKEVQNENGPATDRQTNGEQPKTIDPSLLNRTTDVGTSSVRKLLFDTNSSRRIPIQAQDEGIKRPKTRNTDVLHRAREMGKKIWSMEKLQKILEMVMEPDPYRSAILGHGRGASRGKAGEQSNLLQLLQNERVHGPSDRDPTVVTKELQYFKGPYIYVYDIEEKTKPVMVREYPKVADKKDGEWPQFRVASQGRCPFVEDYDTAERESRRAKEKAVKASVETAAPTLKPPQVPPPKPVIGKRTLAEMEDGQNRGLKVRPTQSFDPSKVSNPPTLDFRAPNQNAFISHAKAGRLLAGEPVASGVQPSKLTSAIRSQMISSTSGVLGAKAGTSKEIHGLQRKVLQKTSTPAVSDLSSRRMAEMSHDSNTFVRSASVSRITQKLDAVEEDEQPKQREKVRRTVSVPVPAKKKARDLKPGYCENCQDKFDDFDEHIVSRKHRKFADNDENWTELDALLSQLQRPPRFDGPAVSWS
ncbi:Dfp1/Him1, central region-domain-containing protein [Echria macrotheca]|uniref:Dfp1/Him1, central region-domain-containing protein n=1 Tax=Echria macrotheca TaxID=438768 RepID=A0AAJ0FA08_9PEZI|nr:Dfp1/Him1, central region-domain-containing protein [Echria macrotheca]